MGDQVQLTHIYQGLAYECTTKPNLRNNPLCDELKDLSCVHLNYWLEVVSLFFFF